MDRLRASPSNNSRSEWGEVGNASIASLIKQRLIPSASPRVRPAVKLWSKITESRDTHTRKPAMPFKLYRIFSSNSHAVYFQLVPNGARYPLATRIPSSHPSSGSISIVVGTGRRSRVKFRLGFWRDVPAHSSRGLTWRRLDNEYLERWNQLLGSCGRQRFDQSVQQWFYWLGTQCHNRLHLRTKMI